MARRPVTLTGDRELDRRLHELGTKASDRIVRSGIVAGLAVIRKGIRTEIPPHMKEARKAIGSRFNRKKKKGIVTAKVGAAVGMKKAKQDASAAKAKAAHGKGKKPGVGIGARNIHWLLLGTGPRTQKTTGRSTGVMPILNAVHRGYFKTKGQAEARIIEIIRNKIDKEARQIAGRRPTKKIFLGK